MATKTDFFELYDTNGKRLKPKERGSYEETGLNFGEGLSNKIKMSLLEKDEPEIRLYGIVDEKMADYARHALMFLHTGGEHPPLKAIITTTGGSVNAGMEISSLLSGYEGGVHGYVEGYAYSAGAQYILSGCLIRYAHKYSRLLFHYVHAHIDIGEYDLAGKNRMHQIRTDLKNSNDQTVEILVKRTGRSEREIRKLLCKECLLTAKESKDFGLIDVIYSYEVKKFNDSKGNERFKPVLCIE